MEFDNDFSFEDIRKILRNNTAKGDLKRAGEIAGCHGNNVTNYLTGPLKHVETERAREILLALYQAIRERQARERALSRAVAALA